MKIAKYWVVNALYLIVTLSASPTYGLDINSIVTKQCTMHSGILIDVNQTEVKLITFDGQVQTITANDIDTIFTYGRKTNPFSQFNLQSVYNINLVTTSFFNHDASAQRFLFYLREHNCYNPY